MSGLFITFEGIEGSGKTTQNQKLAAHLQELGQAIIQTREPGGTSFGTTVRQWVLDPNNHFSHPLTEVLLFYADRLEHLATVIEPALADGKTVLCDRYVDSTWAYQVGGRRVSPQVIDHLNDVAIRKPDLTILLDISEEEGIRRAKKRAQLDRFEQEEMAFHQRVRQAYLDRAAKDPDRIVVISVDRLSADEVFEAVRLEVIPKIQKLIKREGGE